MVLAEEAGTRSKGGYGDKRPEQKVKATLETLRQQASLIVQTDDDRTVGCLIGKIVTRASNADSKTVSNEPRNKLDVSVEFAVDECLSYDKVFSDYPKANRLYDIFALSVHDDFKRRGIATKLTRMSIEIAESRECDCVCSVATSPFSERIFEKLGMRNVSRLKWKDVEIPGEDQQRPYFDRVQFATLKGFIRFI